MAPSVPPETEPSLSATDAIFASAGFPPRGDDIQERTAPQATADMIFESAGFPPRLEESDKFDRSTEVGKFSRNPKADAIFRSAAGNQSTGPHENAAAEAVDPGGRKVDAIFASAGYALRAIARGRARYPADGPVTEAGLQTSTFFGPPIDADEEGQDVSAAASAASPPKAPPSIPSSSTKPMSKRDYVRISMSHDAAADLAALEASLGMPIAAVMGGKSLTYESKGSDGSITRAFEFPEYKRGLVSGIVGTLGSPRIALSVGPIDRTSFRIVGGSGREIARPPQMSTELAGRLRKVAGR